MSASPRKIVQIMPADDVAAVFRVANHAQVTVPIFAWALVEDSEFTDEGEEPDTYVMGLVGQNPIDILEFVDKFDSPGKFLGYDFYGD
jgi:hypothetical protein